ncbi:DNA photolyase family protein [Thermomicrobiaceae bacterium CFH 74404]|uniref:Deoxyribodipyrimidine photo-lyase n=1 Tax=Thermalbibacter longus TaxID=2951981 RepID=A0AA42B9F2_9BACT|nr:deoxyribodipyrimidine photo-lyase [Thermalbibacter longus]MCM8748202.1 DNA photolyase family protein [Thermalbibacter longus]
METPIALWWIRRDLRLHDNQALAEAMRLARTVIPVFVLDPALLSSASQSRRRTQFLFASLACLDRDLRSRGSKLIVRSGTPVEVLERLACEVGARWVVAEADYSPYALRRDRAVAQRVDLRLCPGLTLQDPRELRAPSGRPYTVFTAFARSWWQRPAPQLDAVIPPPARLPPVEDVSSERIVAELDAFPVHVFPPGEAEARARLDAFVSGSDPPIFRYASERNRLDGAGSSRLSPYLRFGMVSVREAWCRASQLLERAPDEASRAGVRAWLNELVWREFYITLLYSFPRMVRESLRPEYREIEWDDAGDALAAWYRGQTGYPAVDAAMRQLAAEGWISNRARMLVASFLVKDLLLDWRLGERWFFQQLIDGDPAANSGGWQWSAGTGTDAAPYFRVFNPTKQGERYDPGGRWVRKWVPELCHVPDEFIHRPWAMPRAVQERCGCRIGREYPSPIVDHAVARQRAIARYRAARSAATDR